MQMMKLVPILLAFAATIPERAHADSGGEATETVLARRPPPAYRPIPRPYYRPPPRRVYVVPSHAPRPRRAAEPLYDPALYFGIGVHGTSVLGASESEITSGLGSGGGFDLSFGLRIAPRFSLDFNWLLSLHDAGTQSAAGNEAALSSFSVAGRYFFSDRSRQTQPYLHVGVGAYILGRDSWEFDSLTGAGIELGGGADIYLSRSVSIGGKLLYRGAYLDNADKTWSSFPTETAWLSGLTYGGDIKFHF
jgi:hypothetical protein